MRRSPLLFTLLAWIGVPALAQVDLSGVWGPTFHEDSAERGPGPELCNNLDDDCDTLTDETFDCVLGSSGACATSCSSTGTRTGTCRSPQPIIPRATWTAGTPASLRMSFTKAEASPLAQITTANVNNLQLQWAFQARSLEKFEATPLVVDVLAPGYVGEKRLLVIALVRILFPATGILVFSAWCLGVVNHAGEARQVPRDRFVGHAVAIEVYRREV